VVEIPHDDTPPPGWGQWESWPAPAPEPAAGVLVTREDNCMMSSRPTHGAEASSSRASLPASDTTVARLEQERERVSAPPVHFSEAQDEQALWQEFHDHGVSLNNTLNKALRMHAGPACRCSRYAFFYWVLEFFASPPFLVSPRLRFL
jgi:hypothetical protein